MTVMSPMPGTPAFKAGVMPGDRIIFVDDRDLKDMKLDEAVDLMRGEVGTKVKLTLSRKAENGEYKNLPDLTLKRQKSCRKWFIPACWRTKSAMYMWWIFPATR